MKQAIKILLFFICATVSSQNDSLNKLDEIVLYGNFSPEQNTGFSISIFNDSLIKNRAASLGEYLQNNANLYFKQNGAGMVSSISLRGTSASHTGVFWNGIEVNSSLNGQTDFNTIPISGFDAIEIRKGGGSVLFGSGAIGGAINMSDRVEFGKSNKALFNLGLGSFNTYKGSFQGVLSNDQFFAKISMSALSSENDYPYLDTDLVNENGEIKNYAFQSALAWKLDNSNELALYSSYVNNDRNNSRTLTSPSNSKLKSKNNRLLLSWKNIGYHYSSNLNVAYLDELTDYYFNKDLPTSSLNKSKNVIAKYDFDYFLNNNTALKSGIKYKYSLGEGSNISKKTQNDFEAYVLFHQKILNKLIYNASIRKGFSSGFDIPFIYSLDANYKINNNLNIRGNIGSNYRMPTFNDLYWEPGGNPDLKTENSNTAEIGFNFHNKNTKIEFTSYYLKSKNLIQWVPVTGDFWQPQNIKRTTGYGIEISAEQSKDMGEHEFNLQIQYSYSISKDNENDKQLIYVPINKGNSNLNYRYKNFRFSYNLQYTGEVFTTTSNTIDLNSYWLSNISMNQYFLNNKLGVGLRINNLFNENYQSVAYRPMPGRNFEININYKLN